MPFSRLKKLNTTECLWVYVLRILADRPMHAYVIRTEIERRFGFRPGTMTAYKVLYLLHTKGFVRKASRGRKKVYSLTPKGRKELKKSVVFYQRLAALLNARPSIRENA